MAMLEEHTVARCCATHETMPEEHGRLSMHDHYTRLSCRRICI